MSVKPISDLEAAQLSDAAYDSSKAPSGWTLAEPRVDVGDNSFSIFKNETTHTIVFAFKGTNSIGELYADLADQGVGPWQNLKNLADEAYDDYFYDDNYAGWQIISTGHSLGGGMAQTFSVEHVLTGYGQNSLPIAKALADSIPEFLDKYTAYATSSVVQFHEVNIAGDIATWWYKDKEGFYLDSDPFTLTSRYSELQNFAAVIFPLGGVPSALLALFGGVRAHLLDTVIMCLSDPQAGTTDTSAISSETYASMAAAIGLTAQTVTAEGSVSFSTSEGVAANINLQGTTILFGDPLSDGNIIRATDSSGDSDGPYAALVNTVFANGSITRTERITSLGPDAYNISIYAPGDDALVVEARVSAGGTYKITWHADAMSNSWGLELPDWAKIPKAMVYQWDGDGEYVSYFDVEPGGWGDYSNLTMTLEVAGGVGVFRVSDPHSYGIDYFEATIGSTGAATGALFVTPDLTTQIHNVGGGTYYSDQFMELNTGQLTLTSLQQPSLTITEGVPTRSDIVDFELYSSQNYQLSSRIDWYGGGQRIIGSMADLVSAKGTIVVDSSIEQSDFSVALTGGGTMLEIRGGNARDIISIALTSEVREGMYGLVFSDGSEWTLDDMLDIASEATQTTINGSSGSDAITVPNQSAEERFYIDGKGGGDVITLSSNFGSIEINESDSPSAYNVLQTDISQIDDIVVSASVNGRDLILSNKVTGGLITLDGMLISGSYGVDEIKLLTF